MSERHPYWISWYGRNGTFEYEGPWWITGQTMDDPPQDIFCAAVKGYDEDDAWSTIFNAHDEGAVEKHGIQMRFVSRRNKNWSPFQERYPKAEWMKWPYPEEAS